MTRIHRLQHVERLGATDLADDDAVRPHTEAVAHKVALGDLPASLDVGRARLEAYDMRLAQL